MRLSSSFIVVIFTFLVLLLSTFTVFGHASSKKNKETPTTTTMTLRPRVVNMSRLLHIPPSLKKKHKKIFDNKNDLVDPSDTQKQKQISTKLREWAFAQLHCEKHAAKNEACLEEKEYPEEAERKRREQLSSSSSSSTPHQVELFQSSYLCSPDSVHAWNILGAIFSNQNNADNSIIVGANSYDKLGCLQYAIKCDPTYYRAWNNLVHRVPTSSAHRPGIENLPGAQARLEIEVPDSQEGFFFERQKFTKIDMYVNVLQNAPWNAEAWYNLAMLLPSSSSSTEEQNHQSEKIKRNPQQNDDPTLYVTISSTKYTKKDCYIQSIRHGGTNNGYAWNNLGNLLLDPVNDQVQVYPSQLQDGTFYTKLDCYLQAVRLAPFLSSAWYNLGSLMGLDQKVGKIPFTTVMMTKTEEEQEEGNGEEKEFTKSEALIQSLVVTSSDQEEAALRKSGQFWTNLGNSLRTGEKIFVPPMPARENYFDSKKGQQRNNNNIFSKKQCYIKALELDGSLSSAWNNLGSILPLEAANKASIVRLTPGANYKGKSKRDFTRKDCYVEAIRHDPSFATAWQNLGDILGMKELLQSDGNGGASTASTVRTNAKNLDELIREQEEKKKRENQERIRQEQQAEEHKDEDAVNEIDEFAEIDGKKYNKRRCFVEAIKLNPYYDSYSWTELGVIAQRERDKYNSIQISFVGDDNHEQTQQRFTAKDCFVRAIEADQLQSSNYRAWYNLGVMLNSTSTGETVNLKTFSDQDPDRQQQVNSQDCFIHALQINPHHCPSWNALGNTVVANENDHTDGTFKFGDKLYKKQDAYIQSILCDYSPENNHQYAVASTSSAWYNLGVSLNNNNNKKNDDFVIVGELGKFTMKDCFVQAVNNDPSNADSWYNLGLTLGVNEKTVVDLDMFGKRKRAAQQHHQKDKTVSVAENMNLKVSDETKISVDRRHCFEAHDAINQGGRAKDVLGDLKLESSVKLDSLLLNNNGPKFVDEEDDDDEFEDF